MQSDGDSHMNFAGINVGGTLKTTAIADQDNLDQGAMTVLTRCNAGTQVINSKPRHPQEDPCDNKYDHKYSQSSLLPNLHLICVTG